MEQKKEAMAGNTLTAVEAKNKHTGLQDSIDNAQSVHRELSHLIDSIQGNDSPKEPTSENPNASMVEVLENGARQIEDNTQNCRDCISRIRELLFG